MRIKLLMKILFFFLIIIHCLQLICEYLYFHAYFSKSASQIMRNY